MPFYIINKVCQQLAILVLSQGFQLKEVAGHTSSTARVAYVGSAASRARGGGRLTALTQGGCAARPAHPATRARRHHAALEI